MNEDIIFYERIYFRDIFFHSEYFSPFEQSLWGSWTIVGPNHRGFFAGDTGYCNIFRDIGNLYGPFDIAAIPIGAYTPR